MSEQVLKKLAQIFDNQHKVLKKLADRAPNGTSRPVGAQVYSKGPEETSDYKPTSDSLAVSDEELEEQYDGRESIPDLDMEEEMEGVRLMHEAEEMKDRPANFDKTVQFHLRKDPQQLDYVIRQLEGLAAGDPAMWRSLSDFYRGWSPKHIAELVQKLKESR